MILFSFLLDLQLLVITRVRPPSGRSWAATTTEGLLVYSLDGSLIFDPFDLDLDVTPASIRKQLRLQQWASAIVLAFRLNEKALKQEVLETVPHEQSE